MSIEKHFGELRKESLNESIFETIAQKWDAAQDGIQLKPYIKTFMSIVNRIIEPYQSLNIKTDRGTFKQASFVLNKQDTDLDSGVIAFIATENNNLKYNLISDITLYLEENAVEITYIKESILRKGALKTTDMPLDALEKWLKKYFYKVSKYE